METLEEIFLNRTKYHIALVNKYAKLIGKSYPNHDSDKLDNLLYGYKYYSKPHKERTTEEQKSLDDATLIHILTQEHHPEHWTNDNLDGFTRKDYTPNGPIDSTNMPLEAITEMICDWFAVSEEKGTNTAREWFNMVNRTRWKFSLDQEKFILNLISKIEQLS